MSRQRNELNEMRAILPLLGYGALIDHIDELVAERDALRAELAKLGAPPLAERPESQFLDANHTMRTYDRDDDGFPRDDVEDMCESGLGSQAWEDRIDATIRAGGHVPDWYSIEMAVILDRAVRTDNANGYGLGAA